MSFDKVKSAWLQAANDLEIEVKTDFSYTTSANVTIRTEIFIPNFGNSFGFFVYSLFDMEEHLKADKYGFKCCALNPMYYSTYNRERFIDILNNMEYYGDDSNKPTWYTGKKWS